MGPLGPDRWPVRLWQHLVRPHVHRRPMTSPATTPFGSGKPRRAATIRARLLLLVLVVLLPGLVAALVVLARTYQAEQDAVQRNLRDTARAAALLIDRELMRRDDIARVLAVLALPGDADAPDAQALRELHARAREATAQLPGWVELVSERTVLLDTRAPAGQPPRPRRQPAPLHQQATLEAVSGGAAADGPGQGQTLSDGAVVRLVHPVLRGGPPLYNLRLVLPAAVLQNLVDQQKLPETWLVTVLDQAHRVVARQPGGAAYVGRTATPDFAAQLDAGREGSFRSVSLDGHAVQGYFSRTPQGWTYLMAVPREGQLAGLPPQVLALLGGALWLLGVAVLGALWVARGIARPVEALQDAALALKEGRPVPASGTGMAECDAVAATLHDAGVAIGNAQHELERQVSDAVDRTRLAEQRVAQAQRIAALGRLTGGVAHDFNNLLGVISNCAHLIERQTQQEAIRQPLAATLRAVEVGSQLTRQLLRVGGRQPVVPRRIALASYLPELRELLAMVLRRGITLQINVAPDTPCVEVDASELELAVLNVALNARDAMPGGGRFTLQAGSASPAQTQGLAPGPYVQLNLQDTGEGMSAQVAGQVFEPFFTTKAFGKGTGLGLSQVHGFCTQAGGAVRLLSAPGQGTTVTLLLPASQQEAQGNAQEPLIDPAAAGWLDGARLLLVDGDDALASATSMLLESYGCRVQRAGDAPQALALLRLLQQQPSTRIDLVLSEVSMPGALNGIALARAVREAWPDTPVLLLTGDGQALHPQTDPAAFTVLSKPVSGPRLVNALVAQLRQAPRRSGHTP